MKNVPNILSLIRLLMVPLFVWLFLADSVVAALVVFILAGATDVADGFIARKYNCTSTLGKILDPLADKAIQLAAFLCLWCKGYVPGWMPVIYLVKELATVIGAFIIFRKTKFVVKSNFFGKLATVLVFGAVFVIAVFGNRSKYYMCACCSVFYVLLWSILRRKSDENDKGGFKKEPQHRKTLVFLQ